MFFFLRIIVSDLSEKKNSESQDFTVAVKLCWRRIKSTLKVAFHLFFVVVVVFSYLVTSKTTSMRSTRKIKGNVILKYNIYTEMRWIRWEGSASCFFLLLQQGSKSSGDEWSLPLLPWIWYSSLRHFASVRLVTHQVLEPHAPAFVIAIVLGCIGVPCLPTQSQVISATCPGGMITEATSVWYSSRSGLICLPALKTQETLLAIIDKSALNKQRWGNPVRFNNRIFPKENMSLSVKEAT